MALNPDYVPANIIEPATWTYDVDPATGNSRASYPGEVVAAGNPIGGPVTGTGLQVLQTGPTIIGPTITGTIAGAPTIPSPTITGTVAGAPLMPVAGVVNGSNAAAGQVGEFITATTGSAVNLTTAVPAAAISIALTAGDWDIWGIVTFTGPTMTAANAAVSNAPTSFGGNVSCQVAPAAGGVTVFAVCQVRYSVAAPMTAYLIGVGTFTGTCTLIGTIFARRAR
jgi:hypothetical protein